MNAVTLVELDDDELDELKCGGWVTVELPDTDALLVVTGAHDDVYKELVTQLADEHGAEKRHFEKAELVDSSTETEP
jgi:hypothetical protein